MQSTKCNQRNDRILRTITTTIMKLNWPEANQLANVTSDPGTKRNKFNEWSEQVLNPGASDLKAKLSNHWAALPRVCFCFQWSPSSLLSLEDWVRGDTVFPYR